MFQFVIEGDPTPQEQMNMACDCPGAHKCKKWLYNPSKKHISRLQWHISPTAPKEPLKGPVELTLWFFLPIPPRTASKTRQAMLNRIILPCITPDEDNCSYLITNALKKLVYEDDKQICVKHVYKYYGEEGKTVIKVRPILQLDPLGYHEEDFREEC
jgi:Holliday junction resolvase RusA-like endonuclease